MNEARTPQPILPPDANHSTREERLQQLMTHARDNVVKSNIAQARKYLDAAHDLAETMGNLRIQGRVCMLRGSIENQMMNYDKALEYYYCALKTDEELKNNSDMCEDLNAISSIYGKTGSYDKAHECLQRALELCPVSTSTYGNLAIIFTMQEDHETALRYLDTAISLHKPQGHPYAYIYLLTNKAVSLALLKRNTETLEVLKTAEAFSLEHFHTVLYPILITFMQTYKDTGQLTLAEEYLQKALAAAESSGHTENQLEAWNNASELYASTERHEAAYSYLKKVYDTNYKAFTDRTSQRLAELHTFYEIEKKELETRQILEKAAKLSSIGVMAAGITHEINQPLCAIKVNADSLLYWLRKNQVELPHHFMEDLQQISDASTRIDKIIQHIRSFWVIEDSLKAEAIPLNQTIMQALQLVERQAYSHGVELEILLSNTELYVKADAVPVEEIVINLVINAIQALDETERFDKRISVTTYADTKRICMEVTDNGKGIPPELGEKIFDPFYSQKAKAKGMGLGLAIVQLYARQYNAEISYQNNPEGGVTFTLCFPLTEAVCAS